MSDDNKASSGNAAVQSRQAIASDLPCRRCGYNLRGLATPGRCPECNAELVFATSGNQFRFCDPEWVMKLARGMSWLVAAVAVAMLLLVSVVVASVFFRQAVGGEVRFVASVVVATIALIGISMITSKDPGGDEFRAAKRARLALRAWVVGSVPLYIAAGNISAIPLGTRYVLFAIQFLVGVVGVFVFFHFARQLALRIPDQKLADESLIVMWGVLTSYLLLTGLTMLAIAPGSVPNPMAWVFGMSCSVLVGCAVFSLWSAALLWRFCIGLRSAARESQRTWTLGMTGQSNAHAT
jgi:hypothetical protein